MLKFARMLALLAALATGLGCHSLPKGDDLESHVAYRCESSCETEMVQIKWDVGITETLRDAITSPEVKLVIRTAIMMMVQLLVQKYAPMLK